VTFQSCGYNAPFLSVTCTNGNTGGSGAEILRVDDVTPHACAMRLATACGTAGYRTSVNGDSVDIFGTGIRVDTAGPTFTTETF
jgi:hypothetical protein